ncbi:beta-glucosidase 31 [Panicum miliaceum]|uniref:Beta-glucosidase 31 n=1 Tax=Panicum miliaceum TaxID=4540 RepID=A0A3L6T9E8_PANMI|nr:beta-glucosidase 31 [Panicum miliaceum]
MGKALGCAALLLLLLLPAALAEAVTRADFPPGFVFGVGSSAYQVRASEVTTRDPELLVVAALPLGGLGLEFTVEIRTWLQMDFNKLYVVFPPFVFSPRFAFLFSARCHWIAGYSIDNATGDVTADQYHKYKEDVKLLHEMGVDAYRMSIAWPRLIPDGRGAVNPKGLEYYNNLIDELLSYATPTRDEAEQGGRIGLTLLGWWYEPATETPDDIAAAARMNDFHIGCRLDQKLRDYMFDAAVAYDMPFLKSNNQFPFGLTNDFTTSTPWALKKMLKHLQVKYKNPAVMIHENGAADQPDPSGANTNNDEFRSQFLQDYIEATLHSIRNGSNVQGYFVWSFLDVFEYLFSYRLRFGIYGVDFNSTERTRYQRHSAKWYSSFLRGGELRPVALPDGAYSQ